MGDKMTFPTRLSSVSWCGWGDAEYIIALAAACTRSADSGLPYDSPEQCAIAHSALRELDRATILWTGGFND